MSLDAARAHWKAGRGEEALAAAWQAYDAAPDGADERRQIAGILKESPNLPCPGRGEDFRTMLRDPALDPNAISLAAWYWLVRETGLLGMLDDPMTLAAWLEGNALALTLLDEDLVIDRKIEKALTDVRRRLLEERRWRDFPRLTAALLAQAALNGGAWPFEESERALLPGSEDFVRAYLPAREAVQRAAYDDPVTQAVAQQYEGWPYPQWRRITRPKPISLAEQIRRMDPDGPAALPESGAEILVAGCGTGRQVASKALRFAQDRFTAIDISEASLRYARMRCAAAGVTGVDFRMLDLYRAAELGKKFDAVLCTGVLHHLPDPEGGWAALAGVLKPGGVMHVMVYSKVARMRVAALRRSLGEFAGRAMSDDVLRAVRQRVLERNDLPAINSRDFYSLAGVHDLLMHRHEDLFEVARIRRALETLSLELLRFEIPRNEVKIGYHAAKPHDPLQRDFAAWAKLELANPSLYTAMYDLWCRKPV